MAEPSAPVLGGDQAGSSLSPATRLVGIPPEPQPWRERLIAFYTIYNPVKVPEVDQLLVTYKGKVRRRFEGLPPLSRREVGCFQWLLVVLFLCPQ
jgi:hypothetical protein